MIEKYNSDLANGLGNLISRVIKLSENADVFPKDPKSTEEILTSNESDINKVLLKDIQLERALFIVMNSVGIANKYIEDNKPWELVKNNPSQFEVVMMKLNLDLMLIYQLLIPFMPETSEKIKTALETKKVEPLFQRIK